MKILRTPESCFANLPDYDFAPHYLEVADERFGPLRMHYIDEGEHDAPVILLTPTQGSWVYIYRHMIPSLVAAGLRVIAPDYIGFGRSDKLPEETDYTFERHITWIRSLLDQLEIRDATGFLLDWGGFFGLRIAGDAPDYFSRLILLNTQLPTGEPSSGHEWFRTWRADMLGRPSFPQGGMVEDGTVEKLAPEIIAAYDAPYPDERYKTGPRRFPMILPIELDDPSRPANLAAWEQLGTWKKPTLALFAKSFHNSAMGPAKLLEHIPGTQGQKHQGIENASFYIVEDQPELLARLTIEFIKSS
jgi:haloalkane dehalogenase